MTVGMSLCFARRHPPARRAIPTAPDAGRVGIRGGWYKIQGPSGKGWLTSTSLASAASLSVLGATCGSRAALLKLSKGSFPSIACVCTGPLWCERREVTRSRAQRWPWPYDHGVGGGRAPQRPISVLGVAADAAPPGPGRGDAGRATAGGNGDGGGAVERWEQRALFLGSIFLHGPASATRSPELAEFEGSVCGKAPAQPRDSPG